MTEYFVHGVVLALTAFNELSPYQFWIVVVYSVFACAFLTYLTTLWEKRAEDRLERKRRAASAARKRVTQIYNGRNS